jgi:hypothetical protein
MSSTRRNLKVSVLAAVAAGVCMFPLQASANSKTVSVDGRGRLTTPSTSGVVTFTDLKASAPYGVVDAIEALPRGTGFAYGSYTLSWGVCARGSAVGGSFKVVSGGSYPSAPPKTNPFPTGVRIRSSAAGGFSCAYTLAYPAGHVPAKAVSVRNDFWLVNSEGIVATQVASKSVKPGAGPGVPEVSFAILIPVAMLLLGGGYVLLGRRRAAATGF